MNNAIQFTGLNFDEVEAFVGGDMGKDGDGNLVVASPDGALRLEANDWVIKEDGAFRVARFMQ